MARHQHSREGEGGMPRRAAPSPNHGQGAGRAPPREYETARLGSTGVGMGGAVGTGGVPPRTPERSGERRTPPSNGPTSAW